MNECPISIMYDSDITADLYPDFVIREGQSHGEIDRG